jgi:peptide/nickel transport system permease protein
MLYYIVKRLLWMIPVILGVTVLVFTLMYFVPGDPAQLMLPDDATEAEIEEMRDYLGLNQGYVTRLFKYMSNAFLHGDFGNSYRYKTPVIDNLLQRLPRTVLMALLNMALSLIIGIPLGVTAAVHQNGPLDTVSMILALIGVSMPSFWLAMMLVLLFSVKLGWLPATGFDGFKYYILPAISGSMGGVATMARQTRSSMLEVIRSDYITTARAKGVAERKVIYGHALPNALIPIITIAGGGFASMLGGTLILETVFSIPGLGSYIITGVNNRDYPIVQGGVIFLAIAFSIMMLVVDLVYAFVDPRIKAQYQRKRRS